MVYFATVQSPTLLFIIIILNTISQVKIENIDQF
jgi:hypothetical protein